MLSNSSFLLHCWLFFLIFLVLCCFQFSGRFELCICYFSGSLDEFKWNRCSTDWNLRLSNSGISLPTPTRRSIKPVLVACRVRFVSTAVDEIAFARLSQPAFFSSFFLCDSISSTRIFRRNYNAEFHFSYDWERLLLDLSMMESGKRKREERFKKKIVDTYLNFIAKTCSLRCRCAVVKWAAGAIQFLRD